MEAKSNRISKWNPWAPPRSKHHSKPLLPLWHQLPRRSIHRRRRRWRWVERLVRVELWRRHWSREHRVEVVRKIGESCAECIKPLLKLLLPLLKVLKLLRWRHILKAWVQGCYVRVETLLDPLHLSRLEELLSHLHLHILKAQVHLILHLSCQTLNLTRHPLLHGCKIWIKVTSWRSPLLLHWRLWRWHGMLCCSCTHMSIIITVTIIILPMYSLIHIISRERSQGPQEKSSVILERPERSVLALTYPSETSLGLDDRHNIRCKV